MIEDPRRLVAVFAENLSDAFTLDAVQLVVSPARLPERVRPPMKPLPGVMDQLEAEDLLVRSHGRLLARFEFSDFVLRQRLGAASGDGRRIGSSVNANIHRRLRTRLTAAGLYSEPSLAPGARQDNYLDPRYLSPGVDLHRESLTELLRLVEQARAAYLGTVKGVFGFDLDPAFLRVTVRKIELTWDVLSDIARYAVTAYDPAWRMAFLGAGRRSGFFDPEDDLADGRVMPTKHRVPEGALGSGVLHAEASRADGHRAKLYVKHHHMIRFEAVFSGKWSKRKLGHRIRLSSVSKLDEDLRNLASRPFRALQDVQKQLHCDRMLDLREVLRVFMKAGTAEKVLPIWDALFSGSMFHNPDEEFSNQLMRLQDLGAVEKRGEGLYGATPFLNHTLHLLRDYLSRHALATDLPLPSATKGTTP